MKLTKSNIPITCPIESHADNITPYNVNLTQTLVINKLEERSLIFFKWFNNIYMKDNSDKGHNAWK